MSLKNPIQHQRVLYKHLNDQRVQNLIRARGKSEKRPFEVGQFVTISNETAQKDLADKISSPRNKNIFKIIQKNKDGFSYTLQNILTCAKHEILHNRIQPLSLNMLEDVSFGTPELWKKLAILTNRLRNKFQPGQQRKQGLSLLSQLPGT